MRKYVVNPAPMDGGGALFVFSPSFAGQIIALIDFKEETRPPSPPSLPSERERELHFHFELPSVVLFVVDDGSRWCAQNGIGQSFRISPKTNILHIP